MPAWVWVVAAAAVAFVLWFAWGRGWWRSVRYSWRRAQHVIEQTQTEVIPGAEYIPYAQVSGAPPWPLDWREQTRVELSPEALDLLAAPVDPGPGGDARLSTTPPPGPDQPVRWYWSPPLYPPKVEWNPAGGPEPTRLADTGDLAAAHEAHPSPFDLSAAIRAATEAGGGIVEIPPGTYGPYFATTGAGQAAWLAAQMAVLYDWVRVMVPQVTGWSVGT